MMTLAILMLLVPLISGQRIDITPIHNDNGYTIVRFEETKIIDHYNKFLHIVNISKYLEATEAIETSFKSLKTSNSVMEIGMTIIEKEIISIKQELYCFRNYMKTTRQKRGLINIWGNGMKLLAGTMDSEDSKEIYSFMENVEKNMKQLTDETNKQVEINNNMIQNFETIRKHIIENDVKMNQFYKNISTLTEDILFKTDKNSLILQLYMYSCNLKNEISKIKDNILLSKINLLEHDMFNIDEMRDYNITIEMLPLIKTAVLLKNNLIIFVVSIPIFCKEKFYNSAIIPIPNLDSMEIEFDITFVIINEMKIYLSNTENLLKNNLIPFPNKCIRNLLNENNVCNYKSNKETSITKINEHTIVTKNLEVIEIDQDCIDQKIVIKNHNIISIENCTVKLKEFEISVKQKTYYETFVIPHFITNTSKIFSNFTLSDLNLRNIENRKYIKYVENNHKVTSSLTFVLIMLIIITILLYFKCKSKGKASNTIELKINPCSTETVESMGGGVTSGPFK